MEYADTRIDIASLAPSGELFIVELGCDTDGAVTITRAQGPVAFRDILSEADGWSGVDQDKLDNWGTANLSPEDADWLNDADAEGRISYPYGRR